MHLQQEVVKGRQFPSLTRALPGDNKFSAHPIDDFLNFESWLKVSVTRFSGNWLLWQFFEYLSNR